MTRCNYPSGSTAEPKGQAHDFGLEKAGTPLQAKSRVPAESAEHITKRKVFGRFDSVHIMFLATSLITVHVQLPMSGFRETLTSSGPMIKTLRCSVSLSGALEGDVCGYPSASRHDTMESLPSLSNSSCANTCIHFGSGRPWLTTEHERTIKGGQTYQGPHVFLVLTHTRSSASPRRSECEGQT